MKAKKEFHFSSVLFVVVFFTVTIAATESSSKTIETTTTGILNATRVNIRQGPGLNHQVVGTIITKGTVITVIGRSGDWVRIYYNGLTGFIYSQFLDIKEETSAPDIEKKAPEKIPPPPLVKEPPPPVKETLTPAQKPPALKEPPRPSGQTGLIKDYRLQNHLTGYDKSLTEYHRALKKAIHLVFLFLESIEKRQDLSLDEKQKRAIEFIRQVRWGPENRHYFWINDLDGKMILEPLYPQIEGKICKIFRDLYKKEIFVDFIKTSQKYKEGFVDHHGLGYDGNKSEPRISIVRLFEAWNWVIGTGIALDVAKVWEEPEVELHFLLPPIDDEFPVNDELPASGT